METDEMMFWNSFPKMLSLYEVFSNDLKNRYPNLRVKVSKTQISFYNRHMLQWHHRRHAEKRMFKRIYDDFIWVAISN